jgi:hypothetical protein
VIFGGHVRFFPFALLVACGSEHTVTQLCGHEEEGFDIEEASVLEDAAGTPNMHDAVILEFDTSGLPAGATWRVKSVEIMPMIADENFGTQADGQSVSVEIWDADDPESTEPWVVTQTFDKPSLTWNDVSLTEPYNAYYYPDQRQAWWTFDFSDEIPTSGMSGPEYLVSVAWDGTGLPTMGYSNYNRSCTRNWTDYADGVGWVLNGGDLTCSWPMLRVSVEVLQEQTICNEDSEVVE